MSDTVPRCKCGETKNLSLEPSESVLNVVFLPVLHAEPQVDCAASGVGAERRSDSCRSSVQTFP